MPKPIRVCPVCGNEFQSAAKKFCSRQCSAESRRKPQVPCSIDDCESPVFARGICAKHYARVVRHGSPDAVTLPQRKEVLKSYRMLHKQVHPLADAIGDVYEHRVVLYDAIGDGEHPCHWCGRLVAWHAEEPRDRLVVDHVDEIKYNNDLTNLVPSCVRCNSLRLGHYKHRRTCCLKGHPYSGENLILVEGGRRCRACRDARIAREYVRRKESRRLARDATIA